MRRNFILDATVLLHNPRAMLTFPDSNVIIPIEVIEQIDDYKRDADERGRNSRHSARILDGLRSGGSLSQGIRLDNGGMLRVACEPLGPASGTPNSRTGRVDDRVLALALHMRELQPEAPPVVVTKSVNLRLKADAFGVDAQDYDVDRSSELDEYAGWSRRSVSSDCLRDLRRDGSVEIDVLTEAPNEYILLTDMEDGGKTAMGRVDPGPPARITALEHTHDDAVGIRPLNLEQTFAFDALLSDEIKLVTLSGKAGTGKTLLAVAAGLRKVFQEDRYNRLLVFRPTMPVGRDIGHLPGDLREKMQPWMQPICDALELVREQDRRNPSRALPPDLLNCEEIRIEPLTYIRGRSIPHQYIIVDEAQNLTPLEVKTAITRVGLDTKIVLTGDPEQIDNPYVDAMSNGLTYLVGHFRHSHLSAHLSLQRGERSALAETAANLL